MNHTELQALRRLLFFTQQEAAALVGHASHRAWQHWEDGQRAVPADVAERLRMLAQWRGTALLTIEEAIVESHRRHGRPAAEIVLVWYASADDWATLPDRDAAFWRPHCSAMAELLARYPAIRLVRFDAPAYAAWLAGRADSESMRSAWAGITNGRE